MSADTVCSLLQVHVPILNIITAQISMFVPLIPYYHSFTVLYRCGTILATLDLGFLIEVLL